MTSQVEGFSGETAPQDRRLRIDTHQSLTTAIVRLQGDVEDATADQLCEAAIIAAAEHRPPAVVVDMRDVGFCDTAGLKALATVKNAVRANNGDFALTHLPRHVRRLLAMSGLARQFAT